MREDVINRVMAAASKEEWWDKINRWIPDEVFQPWDPDLLEQQIRGSTVLPPSGDDPVGLILQPASVPGR